MARRFTLRSVALKETLTFTRTSLRFDTLSLSHFRNVSALICNCRACCNNGTYPANAPPSNFAVLLAAAEHRMDSTFPAAWKAATTGDHGVRSR
jgi:hypothetical protein